MTEMCKNKKYTTIQIMFNSKPFKRYNLIKTKQNQKPHKCKETIENKTGILSYVSNGEMRSGNKKCKNRATTVLGRENVDRIPMCSFTATIYTILNPSIDKFDETNKLFDKHSTVENYRFQKRMQRTSPRYHVYGCL
ncbi:unnamed protein product [Chrysodeixis includens]|uniref:Uncharacterized protein n=1 Tax=Chrysodeixis includens TaxID=689277 RepID=A0A9P0FR70_CHRIL|nr:unnamed protein product [Chrysodeixis includens]